ncbi:MAG: DUF885 domain-containing protein [Xanthomonadales bacterium]|nr:DUF885 domain-containing protein [Xanthomonadales bacterium]
MKAKVLLQIIVIIYSLSLTACASISPNESLLVIPESQTGDIPTLAQALRLSESPAPDSTSTQANPELAQMFQQYFDEGLALNPISGTFLGLRQYNSKWTNHLSSEHRQLMHDYHQRWLDKLNAFERENLNNTDLVSLQVLSYQLHEALEGEQYPAFMVPISQFYSLPNFLAQLGSGMSVQPFNNLDDYNNWQLRADGIPVIFDQAIANMREGIAAGVVQPRVIMEKVLPQLSVHIVDEYTDSLFWKPVMNIPDDIPIDDISHIQAEYQKMITAEIIPAYRRLHDFIRDEYLPVSRDSIGWTALPDGTDWYNFHVRSHTTTDMNADEIHQFGLDEVARITAEMVVVKESVNFEGDLPAFFTFLQEDEQFYFDNEEDLLQGYRDLQVIINARLPKLFDIAPKADYEVRAIEAFRAESAAGASYTPGTANGSRSGIFYVNTFNLKAQPKFIMETLSIHEASPGHHFQISIQQKITGMPMFRRFGGFTAFSEGWALYAESLGKELGMFSDPYQFYGRLSDEILRAMRLVVDTGMHAQGWSREQAIEYMLAHSTMAESDVIAEVERYIAIPGQALAYKVGQRSISRLRDYGEKQLGANFDIRAFHRLILTGGAVPLDVLNQQIKAWIDSQQ